MLTVVRRKNRGDVLTISGIVTLPDGTRKRIQRRASTDDWHLANEEASVLATRYLKEAWHGPVKGSRRLGEAIVSYLEAKDRSEGTKQRLRRIVGALRADESYDPPLSQVDQDLVTRLRDQMLRHNPAPATVLREIIVPLRAVVEHAAKKRRWCDPVSFTVPEIVEGRTAFLLPDQAERLIEHSADHLKPLVTFLIATGCRLSEAFSLDWAEDVRLEDGIAIVWADATKSGTRRNVNLPPRAVSALRGLEHRTGPVF